MSNVHLTPSKLAILLFGGVSILAKQLEISKVTVSSWQTRGDGGIPRQHHLKIIEVAKRKKIELSPEDLVFGRDIQKKTIATMRAKNNVDARITT
jgi:hypothetical protein